MGVIIDMCGIVLAPSLDILYTVVQRLKNPLVRGQTHVLRLLQNVSIIHECATVVYRFYLTFPPPLCYDSG